MWGEGGKHEIYCGQTEFLMLLSTTRLCLLTSSLKPGEEDGTGDINVRIMSIKTAFKATGLDEVIY